MDGLVFNLFLSSLHSLTLGFDSTPAIHDMTRDPPASFSSVQVNDHNSTIKRNIPTCKPFSSGPPPRMASLTTSLPPNEPTHAGLSTSCNSIAHTTATTNNGSSNSDHDETSTPRDISISLNDSLHLLSNLSQHFISGVKLVAGSRKLFCTDEYPLSFTGTEAMVRRFDDFCMNDHLYEPQTNHHEYCRILCGDWYRETIKRTRSTATLQEIWWHWILRYLLLCLTLKSRWRRTSFMTPPMNSMHWKTHHWNWRKVCTLYFLNATLLGVLPMMAPTNATLPVVQIEVAPRMNAWWHPVLRHLRHSTISSVQNPSYHLWHRHTIR